MANLHVDVWLTKDRRPPAVRIAKDSMMTLDIEIHDHEVPSGATITAYASDKFSKNVYKKTVRRVSESMLQLDIPEGFFVPGPNDLQIEIKETSTSNPITLPIDVDCARRVQEGSAPATPEKVLPLVERAEAAAVKAEQEAAKIPEDVEGQITTLKEALAETVESVSKIKDTTVKMSVNLFDKRNVVKGKFVSTDDNHIFLEKPNDSFSYFKIENVKVGDKFTVTGVDYAVYCFGSNNEQTEVFNGNVSSISNYNFTIANTNTKYVCVSFRHGTRSIDTYMCVKGTELPQNYVPYGYVYNPEFKESLKNDVVKEETQSIEGFIADNVGIISENLFDENTVVNGYYYSGSVGGTLSKKSNAGYKCFSIDVEPNTNYTLTGFSYSLYVTDNNNLVLVEKGNGGSVRNYTINTGNGTKLCTSIDGNFDVSSFMIVKGEALPSKYVPFGFLLADPMIKGIADTSKGDVYYVGAKKQYTSFTDCIRALKDNTNPKTIYIDGGVYDIYAEIGGDDFIETISDGQSWREICDIIPPNTHIIGLGYVLFTYYPTNRKFAATQLVSPINIIGGNVTLENINCIGRECRYIVHDDGSGDNVAVTHEYKNCTFEKLGGGFVQCFGSGIGNKCNMIFKDCIIKSDRGAFSVHNQWYATESNILFDNCALIGTTNYSARFGSLSTKDESRPITVNMYNCVLDTDVVFNNESGETGIKNPYKLTLVKCSDVNFKSTDYATLQLPPTVIN